MLAECRQIGSRFGQKMSALTSITVPFCFHSVDKICSHNKTAEIKQNLLTKFNDGLAAEIEQTLLLL